VRAHAPLRRAASRAAAQAVTGAAMPLLDAARHDHHRLAAQHPGGEAPAGRQRARVSAISRSASAPKAEAMPMRGVRTGPPCACQRRKRRGPAPGLRDGASRQRVGAGGYSTAFTMSSTTFLASPNTIIVLSM
jgi:hypothetical protein